VIFDEDDLDVMDDGQLGTKLVHEMCGELGSEIQDIRWILGNRDGSQKDESGDQSQLQQPHTGTGRHAQPLPQSIQASTPLHKSSLSVAPEPGQPQELAVG
jgi:hypothetical protein